MKNAVMYGDADSVINESIKLPGVLHAEDGRKCHVRNWEPHIVLNKPVSITVELLIDKLSLPTKQSVETETIEHNV